MADDKKGKAETDEPKVETPPALDVPRETSQGQGKLNGEDAATIVQAGPQKRTVIGCRMSPQALQMAVNVLKVQPWEDVADFMPALIKAKPIFEDELHEYQRKLSESE